MFKGNFTNLVLTTFLLTMIPVVLAAADKEPTTAEKMAGLQTMCTETEKARTERQEADSLYNRLGGYDRILELTTAVVANHRVNEEIKRTMEGVDDKMLAKHVADFVAAGTGGTAEYTGRDLPSSHAHLKLTDADFLSAGGDIVKAMNSMEYGQNEIDEFLCILVSLKDQVVFK
jgi:hemoglobin